MMSWDNLRKYLDFKAQLILDDSDKKSLVFYIDLDWRNFILKFRIIELSNKVIRISDLGSIKQLCWESGYEFDTDSLIGDLLSSDDLSLEGDELVRYVRDPEEIRVFVFDLIGWAFFIWMNHQLDLIKEKVKTKS